MRHFLLFFLLWTTLLPLAEGQDLQGRFRPPPGFRRVSVPEHSFAAFLRSLPLKPEGAQVYYYNGTAKPPDGSYAAVVDWDIGDRDLLQCADAVIRMRATYLYAHGRYDAIQFHFSNGFLADYGEWRKGKRIAVDGNRVYWRSTTAPSDTDKSFRDYLHIVYAYANTASLLQDLSPVAPEEMQIGDVFIQGGYPGHAAIVVDMAENPATGKKVFLLAQSFMPAQDIHVLNNGSGPWYDLEFGEALHTPTWTFTRKQLKRFGD